MNRMRQNIRPKAKRLEPQLRYLSLVGNDEQSLWPISEMFLEATQERQGYRNRQSVAWERTASIFSRCNDHQNGFWA
jgi:hypothetical protein